MLEHRKNIVKVCLLIVLVIVLWPVALAAAPPELALSNYPALKLPQVQGDTHSMANSYEWSSQTGPAQCPTPSVFRSGTRVVYSYIPDILNQQVPTIALWYKLNKDGNPATDDPIAIAQIALTANRMPYASLSLGKGDEGLFGAYMYAQDDSEWVLLGKATYVLASSGDDVPAPGDCPMSQVSSDDTDGDTDMIRGASPSPLDISWSSQMTYEDRQGDSRWCQMSMTYQNNGGGTYKWPQYRPAFLIANEDGSEDGWYHANYYAKEDGWEDGISGTPLSIPIGTEADWTWYFATDWNDQYCASVAVVFEDWVYAAFYDSQGALVGEEVYPPNN